MANKETSGSDEWGEVTEFTITNAAGIRNGISYQAKLSSRGSHTIIITAEGADLITEVLVNGKPARRVDLGNLTIFVATVQHGWFLPVRVRVYFNADAENAQVHLGIFARLGKRLQDAMAKVNVNCLACKQLARLIITAATGGADAVGEGLDQALAALEAVLDDYIDDTILGGMLTAIRNVVNPGRMLAGELCKELGYCP